MIYVKWRITPRTNWGHETRVKSVWETRFNQILRLPFWQKNSAEKMTSLQMCRIRKITPRTGQTFWDRQLCFYVKKLFISEKTQKNELCHFSCHKFCPARIISRVPMAKFDDMNLLWKMTKLTFRCFSLTNNFFT